MHTRLRELRRGQTSVLISHRLSTVRDADLIVVLEAGTIVEQGRHGRLIGLGGRYATMFGLQAHGYQDVDLDGDAREHGGGGSTAVLVGDVTPSRTLAG